LGWRAESVFHATRISRRALVSHETYRRWGKQ
jgi:hypothetical protein